MIPPTAVIDPRAKSAPECASGRIASSARMSNLGRGCKLHSHVVIDGHTKLGEGNEIFPFASIGLKTQDLKWKGGTRRRKSATTTPSVNT